MTGGTESRHSSRQDIARLIIGVVVFGSIWGFLEATLGGFLHMIIFPNKGAIMAGIGTALMASALAIYKKPGMLPVIGIIAASFKLMSAWIFSLPVTSIHIINPAMAIIFESLVFSLVAVFLMKKIEKDAYVGIGAGILVGIVTAVAWVNFAIHVMNAPAYARVVFTASEFITNQGVVQALFCGIFLPLGYLLGGKLAARTSPWLISRPRYYYATSAVIISVCWIVSALAIMAGV